MEINILYSIKPYHVSKLNYLIPYLNIKDVPNLVKAAPAHSRRNIVRHNVVIVERCACAERATALCIGGSCGTTRLPKYSNPST